jgi:hypothetical protein
MLVSCQQWCQRNKGNNAIVTIAKMPVHQRWQWHHRDEDNNTSLTTATMPSQWGQQCYYNNSKDAWTAKMPVHQQWQQHHNKGNNASSTTAKMPAHWWWQRPNCYEGNDANLMTMLARLQQRRHRYVGNSPHCNDGKNACASTATTPLWKGQQYHCNHGEDACALMMTTTLLQQGQQRQLQDSKDAIVRRATTPSRIKGDNAIVTRETPPAQQRQGCLCIDNSNNAIAMRATIAIATTAKMPAHQRQRCYHDKGDDASLTMSNEGNNASLTMVEMPAHQHWPWCHHGKSNNCHCDNGEDACASTAMTPSWQGQQRQLDNKQQGRQHQWWQQCHCNEGNNASLRTAMMPSQQGQQRRRKSRATMPLLWGQQRQLDNGKDACASTTAMMPSSWGWQSQSQQWQRPLHINGNDAITMRVTIPAQQQATRVTTLAWQWQRCLRIDNGNYAIMTRATIAIVTMAKMPVHWRQQCHHNKGDNASLTTRNKANNACVCTHTNEHIICLCLHALLQTYHMFELSSQLANLANFCCSQARNK